MNPANFEISIDPALSDRPWCQVNRTGHEAMILVQGLITPEHVSTFDKGIREVKKAGIIVNSAGGNSVVAYHVAEALRRIGDTDVFIFAALSGAFLIAMAGTRRAMIKDGRLLIHGPSGEAAGKESVTANYERALCDWTRQPAEVVSAWLRSGTDHTWTAQEALAAGLVDKIYEIGQGNIVKASHGE